MGGEEGEKWIGVKEVKEAERRVGDNEAAAGGEEDVGAGEVAWEEVEVVEEGEGCGEGWEAIEVESVVGDRWRMVYGYVLVYSDCLVADKGNTKSWR